MATLQTIMTSTAFTNSHCREQPAVYSTVSVMAFPFFEVLTCGLSLYRYKQRTGFSNQLSRSRARLTLLAIGTCILLWLHALHVSVLVFLTAIFLFLNQVKEQAVVRKSCCFCGSYGTWYRNSYKILTLLVSKMFRFLQYTSPLSLC